VRHNLSRRPGSIKTGEAYYTVDRVEACLFQGRDRRRVLPGRTSDIQKRDAMSRHATMESEYGSLHNN